MDNLNKEQAALPVKKNIIALLINAKIELQKEAMLKEQREKEAAEALKIDDELKIQNSTMMAVTKQKSELILMNGSFENKNISRKQSMQSPGIKNENISQSPLSLNVRQVSGDLNKSRRIHTFAQNSKANSGSSAHGPDKGGPLEELSFNESAGHHAMPNENSPYTRASSVLRRRDPFNNQKPNLNDNH